MWTGKPSLAERTFTYLEVVPAEVRRQNACSIRWTDEAGNADSNCDNADGLTPCSVEQIRGNFHHSVDEVTAVWRGAATTRFSEGPD